MSSASRPLGVVSLLVATSAWGSLFLVSQQVLGRLDPLWYTLARYTVAALLLGALLAGRGAAPWQALRRAGPALALHGALGFGVFSVMVLAGLARSAPAHGAIIMATMPLTTQALRWALDGQRPRASALPIAVLALAGVALAAGLLHGGPAGAADTAFGDALMLAGTLGWVLYTRGAARFPKLDALEYSALTVIAAWPLLLAAALLASAFGLATLPGAPALQATWQALLYVGVLPSAVAVLAFNHGVRTLGPVTGTAFLNFVPVSALLMSMALGHPPAAHELAGMAMVIGALLWHTAASAAAPARAMVQSGPRLSTRPCSP